jgi:hypothetical protein
MVNFKKYCQESYAKKIGVPATCQKFFRTKAGNNRGFLPLSGLLEQLDALDDK